MTALKVWEPRNQLGCKYNSTIRAIARRLYKRANLDPEAIPRCFGVTSVRGRGNRWRNYISVPLHAFLRGDKEYLTYYVAHELAHVSAPQYVAHGPKFMEAFKMLCPKQHWHFEPLYKPRRAKAAGIEGKRKNDPLRFAVSDDL